MKRGSFFHAAGIYLSALASLFTGHSALAKMPETKEAGKNSKKARFAEQTRGEESAAAGSTDPPTGNAVVYPWRLGIVTTTFWIGEKPTQNNPVPNHKSCWDPRWAENYGGTDTPARGNRTKDYTPANFVPRQNPFYVALPYNDKTLKGHKAEAFLVVPWFTETYRGPDVSVCKGRWIAVRKGDRICYAQWEDAGPFRTDHWQYVFGNERPRPNLNRGAGLDVSPAVRDYLGMDDSDVTDWKFVEFGDVPTGPWSRFGDNNTFVINRHKAEKQLAALAPAKDALPPE